MTTAPGAPTTTTTATATTEPSTTTPTPTPTESPDEALNEFSDDDGDEGPFTDDDIAQFRSDDDGAQPGAAPAAPAPQSSEPAPAATPVAPASQTPVVPAAAPTAPVPPGTPPATPAAAQPQAPGAAPEATPAQPAPSQPDLIARYQTWRKDAEKALVETHFRLSEQDAADMAANPADVVPRLMARVYMDAMEASVHAMAQYLPQALEQRLEHRERNLDAESKFFEAWPGLKAHRDHAVRVAQVYRQLNPQVSFEQAVKDIGAQVAVSLNIPIEQALAKVAAAAAPAPAAPGTPPPHRPINTGAPRALTPSSGGSGNAFTDLYNDDLNDPDD